MSCRSLGTALLLALVLVFTLGAATTFKRSPKKNAVTSPGVEGTVGNEETLDAIYKLDAFAGMPSYPKYYVSADNGGAAAQGDDTNDGLSWANAWRSLQKADELIEATCGVEVIFDSSTASGAADVWDTLDGDFRISGSAAESWDGKLGPPPDDCGSLEAPGAILSNSTYKRATPFYIDATNMTSYQLTEGGDHCSPNSPKTSEQANDALFTGQVVGGGGELNGFLAVQNASVYNYTGTPGLEKNCATGVYSNVSPMLGGNIISLNLRAGMDDPDSAKEGAQMNGSNTLISMHGGTAILLNPDWQDRDYADFDEDCTGGSCGSDDTPARALCEDTDDPYACCGADSSSPGDAGDSQCTGWNAPFVTTQGNFILISDKTYTVDQSQFASGSTTYIAGSTTSASDICVDMVFLGSTFAASAGTDTSVKYPALRATAKGTGTTSSAYVGFTSFKDIVHGSAATPLTGSSVIEIWMGSLSDTAAMDLDLYQVEFLDALGYRIISYGDGGVAGGGAVKDNQTWTNTFDAYCIGFDIAEQLAAAGYAYLVDLGYDTATTPGDGSLDILLRDWFYDDVSQSAGMFVGALRGNHDSGAAMVTAAQADEYHCGGVDACTSANLEEIQLIQAAANSPSPVPFCTETSTATFPVAASSCSSEDGWLPAFILGETVKSFTFGADL